MTMIETASTPPPESRFTTATVLVIDPEPWEQDRRVVAIRPPLTVGDWLRPIRAGGLRVIVPPTAPPIAVREYAGGRVVAVEGEDGRYLCALPPVVMALLDELLTDAGLAGRAPGTPSALSAPREE